MLKLSGGSFRRTTDVDFISQGLPSEVRDAIANSW